MDGRISSVAISGLQPIERYAHRLCPASLSIRKSARDCRIEGCEPFLSFL
jgi:hypothetical protein